MVGYWSKVVHAVIIKQHQTLRTLSKHYLPRGECCVYIYIHVEVIAKIPFLFAEYLQTFDDGHGRTPLTDSQNPANSSSALSSSLWSAQVCAKHLNELPPCLVHIVDTHCSSHPCASYLLHPL